MESLEQVRDQRAGAEAEDRATFVLAAVVGLLIAVGAVVGQRYLRSRARGQSP